MKALSTMTAGALMAVVFAGCGPSVPPMELRNARNAYQDAATAPGSDLAGNEISAAKTSLQQAERSFADDGDSAETRDLAYVAQRKALIARLTANTALLQLENQQAMAQVDDLKRQQLMASGDQLGSGRNKDIEQRTADKLAKMSGVSSKEDVRGLVLTASSGNTFAVGKSDLIPEGKQKLDEFIAAVKDDPRSITVVGHTDSTGNDEKNLMLSRKRAESVRAYVISHGVPEERVTATGVGETEPIADNKTAAGRADNRRVEIILNNTMETTPPLPAPSDRH